MQTVTALLPRPSWRLASMVAALLLLLTTCGGSVDGAGTGYSLRATSAHPGIDGDALDADATGAVPSPNGEVVPGTPPPSPPSPDEESTSAGHSAGDDGPTGPAGDPAPQQASTTRPVPDEVELHEPDLVVRSEQGVTSAEAREVGGTDYVTSVGELTATADDREGEPHTLELMSVDPTSFRPLTPEVTAQAPAVWERLGDGDVLVRHDVAHELGLELGEQLVLDGEAGSVSVRIGALAANGAPPLADIVVPFDVAAILGNPGVNALLVSAEDQPEALVEALGPLGEVELRRPPRPERADRQPASGSVELEPFTYTSRGDGTIAIHGDWVARNIVAIELPGMGTTRCHRAMVPQLYAALQDVIDAGLYDHLQPDQFGGCWVPRHILWNPDRGLSMHAWGLAIDFNVQDNGYGARPQMDPRIVEIFRSWGFEWGGAWSTPDGMHFELERFVEVP